MARTSRSSSEVAPGQRSAVPRRAQLLIAIATRHHCLNGRTGERFLRVLRGRRTISTGAARRGAAGHFMVASAFRDFAYVARDRSSRRFMCHVFRCDTPARTIANTLRDICKRLMLERRPNTLQTGTGTTSADGAASRRLGEARSGQRRAVARKHPIESYRSHILTSC